MNYKRILALIMALILTLSLLCGCGDKTDKDPRVSGDQESDVPPGGNSSDDAQDGEKLVPGLVIDGENVDVEGLSMLTLNGRKIPFDEFRYTYFELDNNFFSFGDDSFWEANPDSFPVLVDYVKYYILENNWGLLLADKYNIELTDEDYAQIEDAMTQSAADFDSEEEYQKALDQSGYTEDLLHRIFTQRVTANRVYTELFAKDGALLMPSDDEIKADLKENYRRVYHVLVSNDHFADQEGYEDATEDELKAAAKEYAEEIKKQIEDGADIYELAQSADDPGMVDNPGGYFFTHGTMVEPFEESAFSLEVGELSEPIETDYGYHVILRLEQDDYAEENFETVKSNYVNDFFNKTVDDFLSTVDIEFSEYYDKLTYDSVI